MIKKVMRPYYAKFCDECGKEISDYTFISKKYPNGEEKHFHSMYTGKETCLEKFERKELKKLTAKKKGAR